ncbi:MAG: cyclic nucleotide-binding protein [Verrucomicrobiales bacterium]|nr:cyclic nucleotide-binding protein [Verrucomicrobiales bacterium]|tara:strand:- start:75 stop:614 length:540 start_codon:yes stop_codon:yes gene_type:complete
MKKVLYILGLLEDKDVDWLVGAGQKQVIPPEEVIVRERNQNHKILLLLDGQVRVSVRGREITTIGPGEFMGEISLLDSRPASATLESSQTSTVLAIPFEKVQEKLARDVGFAARMYQALGIFLAVRLRLANIQLAVGLDESIDLTEETDEAEEIDPELLEKITLAGDRFKWIMDRLDAI